MICIRSLVGMSTKEIIFHNVVMIEWKELMSIATTIAVYLVIFCVLLYGIRIDKCIDRDNLLTRLNLFRGFFAIIIVIGHVVRYEHTFLEPFGRIMLVFVGYYFFVSGWGLARSFYEKPGYIHDFPRKRLLYLVGIGIISHITYMFVDLISPVNTGFSTHSTVIRVILQNLFVRVNWYIRELIVLYILYYLI